MVDLMNARLQKLPWGISSFGVLRDENCIYVDKTDLMAQLIERSPAVFFSRPRRFGKSLLLSCIGELFENGLELFSGLKIENTWKEKTYRVLKLDLSFAKTFDSLDAFRVIFDKVSAEAMFKAGFDVDLSKVVDPIDRWRRFLMQSARGSLVILIDEYDAPLTAHLHEPALFEAARKTIGSFFDVLKGNGEAIKFLFVTGIMRFRQASLFSTFNNIDDASFDSRFGALLGYTEEELTRYFRPHIERAGRELGLSFNAVLDCMKKQYDGFCFEASAKIHVYAPWSVLSFLSKPEEGFGHYWFESAGTPSVLVNYLKGHRMLDPADFDQPCSMPMAKLKTADHVNQLDPHVLLAQAGYLTIKSVSATSVELNYPNEEVRDAIAHLYGTSFWPDERRRNSLAQELLAALRAQSLQDVQLILNHVVHQLDYQNFSLATEAAVRQLVQVFCLGADIPNRIEVHSPMGRSDLELSLEELDVVIEFKFAARPTEGARVLGEALRQLTERDYGAAQKGRQLLRIGLVFAKDSKKFIAIGRA